LEPEKSSILLIYWFSCINFEYFGYYQTLMDYDMGDFPSAIFPKAVN